MEELFNNLIKNLAQSTVNSHNENDIYYDDEGLKKCKICDRYLETIITHPFTGKQTKVNCVCDCTIAREKEEEEKRRSYETQQRILKLQKSSLLGTRYKDVTFENTILGENETFDNAYKRCKNYCEVSSKVLEKGYGIYIYGDSGVGKSHLTACMANELFKQCRSVLFTNFFEIAEIIKGTFNKNTENEKDMIDRIATVDFLFIDDLGTEKVTKNGEDNWLQEKIFEVINKRYNNMKPTVFTSNYSLEQLITERGLMEKTVDRILEMSSAILRIEGESHRITSRGGDIPF